MHTTFIVEFSQLSLQFLSVASDSIEGVLILLVATVHLFYFCLFGFQFSLGMFQGHLGLDKLPQEYKNKINVLYELLIILQVTIMAISDAISLPVWPQCPPCSFHFYR